MFCILIPVIFSQLILKHGKNINCILVRKLYIAQTHLVKTIFFNSVLFPIFCKQLYWTPQEVQYKCISLHILSKDLNLNLKYCTLIT